MNATKEQIQAAFTEWMRRYIEDPEGFMSTQQTVAEGAETYGEQVTPYFLEILTEIKS